MPRAFPEPPPHLAQVKLPSSRSSAKASCARDLSRTCSLEVQAREQEKQDREQRSPGKGATQEKSPRGGLSWLCRRILECKLCLRIVLSPVWLVGRAALGEKFHAFRLLHFGTVAPAAGKRSSSEGPKGAVAGLKALWSGEGKRGKKGSQWSTHISVTRPHSWAEVKEH